MGAEISLLHGYDICDEENSDNESEVGTLKILDEIITSGSEMLIYNLIFNKKIIQ